MPVVQMFMLGVIVFIVLTILYFVPIGMWIQGIVSLGLGRSRIVDLIRMRLRKISPRLVTAVSYTHLTLPTTPYV